MKAEKTFVGSLAVVIALVASGCAASTMEMGEQRGAVAPVVVAPAPMAQSYALSPQPAPPEDQPSHFNARASRMSARVATGRTR